MCAIPQWPYREGSRKSCSGGRFRTARQNGSRLWALDTPSQSHPSKTTHTRQTRDDNRRTVSPRPTPGRRLT